LTRLEGAAGRVFIYFKIEIFLLMGSGALVREKANGQGIFLILNFEC